MYNKKDALFYHLGFFWCLPVSMIFWLIYGILYFCKQIDSVYWSRDLSITWDIRNDSWLARKLFVGRGWGGFAAGCNILILDTGSDTRWVRSLKHEHAHVIQNYKYGIAFFVLYILIAVGIYLFEKELHPYYDHPYEMEARVEAGQPIFIPKSEWQGSDRWLFW